MVRRWYRDRLGRGSHYLCSDKIGKHGGGFMTWSGITEELVSSSEMFDLEHLPKQTYPLFLSHFLDSSTIDSWNS